MVCGDHKNRRKRGFSIWSSQHSIVTVTSPSPRRWLRLFGKTCTRTAPRTSISHLRPSHCVRVQLASSHCILISLYFRHVLEREIELTLPSTHTLTPKKAIPAANVLAGKSNIHAHIVLPKLNAIGLLNAAQIDKLVEKLFTVNVPAFDKGAHLSVVLRTCAASLIIHHRQLTGKFPGNTISSHLYEAALGARFFDPQSLDLSPDLVLDEWSKLVEEDFKSTSIAAECSLQ
jgi:hypothetical protein